jgi:hypothetical protein
VQAGTGESSGDEVKQGGEEPYQQEIENRDY